MKRRKLQRRTKSRRKRSASPAGAPIPGIAIEERNLPIAREVARVAKGGESPRAKLEGALEIVFGAYGESDRDFSTLLLAGWVRAQEDKQWRLTMAWLREQLRLSLEEILAEGVATGAFRRDLDPAAVASVMLGTAEGCLLQSATQGGAVAPEQLVRTLLQLCDQRGLSSIR